MLCPKCRLTMRSSGGRGEMVCPGCGYKTAEKKETVSSGKTEAMFGMDVESAQQAGMDEKAAIDTQLKKDQETIVQVSHPSQKLEKKVALVKVTKIEKTEMVPLVEKSEPEKVLPPKLSSFAKAKVAREENKKKEITSPSKIKKRVKRAEHLTELRQLSKELAGRINDMEIQFDRRLEELQALAVKLEEAILRSED